MSELPHDGVLRVLVVDDDEVDRLTVRRGLAQSGLVATIREARTADEAFGLLASPIDCIFLDYNMPGTDGMQALRRIKSAVPTVPVVMLTGQGDEQVAVALMKAGAVDYVPKGAATPERLAASVRYALELRRANEQTREVFERLRETAEAERAARAEAEQANRAKADFLARMSHDLRTPLNAIGGFTDLVLMGVHGPVTDEQRESLERVQRAQKHLLALINDILGFARLEAGQVELSIGPVEVEPVLQEVRQLMEPQATAKGLTIMWIVGPREARVNADKQRLKQILINLASNAVKFTETGTVTLGWDIAGSSVTMRVTDTGPGIAADKIGTIFDPFVQVGDSKVARNEGVGLGLAISRELTRLMGGTLSVQSSAGAGATFLLEFPAS